MLEVVNPFVFCWNPDSRVRILNFERKILGFELWGPRFLDNGLRVMNSRFCIPNPISHTYPVSLLFISYSINLICYTFDLEKFPNHLPLSSYCVGENTDGQKKRKMEKFFGNQAVRESEKTISFFFLEETDKVNLSHSGFQIRSINFYWK